MRREINADSPEPISADFRVFPRGAILDEYPFDPIPVLIRPNVDGTCARRNAQCVQCEGRMPFGFDAKEEGNSAYDAIKGDAEIEHTASGTGRVDDRKIPQDSFL